MNKSQSAIWKFIEKFALTFFSFLCSIVLARLVVPSAYGDYAIISSIVIVLSTFVANGILNLIVKEKELDKNKLSSIFIYNISFAILMVIVVTIVGLVLNASGNNLGILLIIQSINIILIAIHTIYMAVLVKTMSFKKIAVIALVSGVTSYVISIWMAAQGMGIYALIAQYMINNLMLCIILAIFTKIKIGFVFDFKYIKENIGLSISVMIADAAVLLSRSIQSIIVKGKTSSTVLGFYDKGYTLSKTISDLFYETANTVTFPLLSNNQSDNKRLNSIMDNVQYLFCFVTFPVVVCIFYLGTDVITILFGEVWIESAIYFKVFFLAYIVSGMNVVLSQLLVIKNNYKVYRNLTVIFNAGLIITIVVFYQINVVYIPWLMVGFMVLNFIATLFNTNKIVQYGIVEYISTIKYIALATVLMTVVAFIVPVTSLIGKIGITLIICILYLSVIVIFDRKKLITCVNLVVKKKNGKEK